ncbi:hypothetical protein [Sulfuricurvum sp.]|uniref:hypothetical protein n=1 Tax=Sulfuricurvum sp. TaxID=2025608 RepID=UPI003BB64AF6
MKKFIHIMVLYSMYFGVQLFAGVNNELTNTSSGYDDHAGVTKIYYDDRNESNKTLINPFEKDKNLSCDINVNETYEIRLQNAQFNQIFEYFKWKQNKYAIFLTLEERINDYNNTDKNTTVQVQRRLVYLADYGRKADKPLNLSNKLIFRDRYKGGDIYFKLEVVEIDSADMETYRQIFEPLLEAAKGITQIASAMNTQYTQLLNVMGNALYQHLKKDDLILTYETEFLKRGTVDDNQSIYGQNYFTWGEYYLVRDSQDRKEAISPYIDTKSSMVKLKNDKDETETLSFVHISILKRK